MLSSATAWSCSPRTPAFAMSMSSEILTSHPRQTAPSAVDLRWSPNSNETPRVILGSKSFTRKLLLGELGLTLNHEPLHPEPKPLTLNLKPEVGVKFECISPDIDEKAIRDPDPVFHQPLQGYLAHQKQRPPRTPQ